MIGVNGHTSPLAEKMETKDDMSPPPSPRPRYKEAFQSPDFKPNSGSGTYPFRLGFPSLRRKKPEDTRRERDAAPPPHQTTSALLKEAVPSKTHHRKCKLTAPKTSKGPRRGKTTNARADDVLRRALEQSMSVGPLADVQDLDVLVCNAEVRDRPATEGEGLNHHPISAESGQDVANEAEVSNEMNKKEVSPGQKSPQGAFGKIRRGGRRMFYHNERDPKAPLSREEAQWILDRARRSLQRRTLIPIVWPSKLKPCQETGDALDVSQEAEVGHDESTSNPSVVDLRTPCATLSDADIGFSEQEHSEVNVDFTPNILHQVVIPEEQKDSVQRATHSETRDDDPIAQAESRAESVPHAPHKPRSQCPLLYTLLGPPIGTIIRLTDHPASRVPTDIQGDRPQMSEERRPSQPTVVVISPEQGEVIMAEEKKRLSEATSHSSSLDTPWPVAGSSISTTATLYSGMSPNRKGKQRQIEPDPPEAASDGQALDRVSGDISLPGLLLEAAYNPGEDAESSRELTYAEKLLEKVKNASWLAWNARSPSPVASSPALEAMTQTPAVGEVGSASDMALQGQVTDFPVPDWPDLPALLPIAEDAEATGGRTPIDLGIGSSSTGSLPTNMSYGPRPSEPVADYDPKNPPPPPPAPWQGDLTWGKAISPLWSGFSNPPRPERPDFGDWQFPERTNTGKVPVTKAAIAQMRRGELERDRETLIDPLRRRSSGDEVTAGSSQSSFRDAFRVLHFRNPNWKPATAPEPVTPGNFLRIAAERLERVSTNPGAEPRPWSPVVDPHTVLWENIKKLGRWILRCLVFIWRLCVGRRTRQEHSEV